MDPLSESQIHAAIRALDAGDWPARATLRTALLMALAWHAAQAEIAALRAAGQVAMAAIATYYEQEDALGAAARQEHTKLMHFDRAHGVAQVQDLPEVQALWRLLVAYGAQG